MRKHTTRRGLLGLAVGALAVTAGCAERPDTSVRPLVDVGNYEPSIIDVDNDTVKARLEKLADEVRDLVKAETDWSVVNTDFVNPEIQDVTFLSSEREAAMFAGGGDATASVTSSADWAVFVMSSSETASCWGIRLSGDPGAPTIEYSNIFSPGCSATQMVEEGVWSDQWPEPAPPPTDGTITFGEPLFP